MGPPPRMAGSHSDTFGAVRRHALLQRMHANLEPRRYFEIGVSTGVSLGLSRAPSIGVDPFFKIRRALHCDLDLVRVSSDEFFATPGAFDHFEGQPFDLAFIDGMHLAEYALRDFINTERHAHPASVIVLDDMLPRVPVEGVRDRRDARSHGSWAGDVYKIVDTLRTLRPDLVCLELDTTPTGTMAVLLPDSTSTTLATAYDDVVEAYVVPDPQDIPDAVINRSRALDPAEFLRAPIWDGLRRLRELPPTRPGLRWSRCWPRRGWPLRAEPDSRPAGVGWRRGMAAVGSSHRHRFTMFRR